MVRGGPVGFAHCCSRGDTTGVRRMPPVLLHDSGKNVQESDADIHDAWTFPTTRSRCSSQELFNHTKDAGAMYALKWELSKGLIRPSMPIGDASILDDMQWEIHNFKPNEGYVGKAFGCMESFVVQDVAHAKGFVRTDFGSDRVPVHTIVWVPTEQKDAVIEIGFCKVLDELPDVIAVQSPKSLRFHPAVTATCTTGILATLKACNPWVHSV